MTNGGGVHHSARKRAKAKKKQPKPTTKHKPAKALLAKAVSGNAN
jgi:hypothetical protein